MSLNTSLIREQFPSLDRPAVFFDNPGGTQIARQSAARIQQYLLECNANHEGAFPTSRQSDAILESAHAAMADFLNAARPEEIIFGANMTTLTLHISRSLARTLNPLDGIVVTRLDHDANISPWLLVAEDRGCNVTWVDFDLEDGTLKMEDFEEALETKPKLVAFGYASNALGTINPVRKMTEMAHAAGALVYVDAVQYAPHGPIDVQDLGVDFLVCSSYKFFGPHAGVLYGRYDLLNELKAYKVRPATNSLPGKFETGTQNHEGIAGVLGALEYFEWIGKTFGAEQEEGLLASGYTRAAPGAQEGAYSSARQRVRAQPRPLIHAETGPRSAHLRPIRSSKTGPARPNLFVQPGRQDTRASSPRSWLPRASTFGMATITPWRSPSAWGSKRPVGWCALAPSTTTLSTKWPAWARH